MHWYRDTEARWLILRYAAWLGALSLAWETLQLPLYTIWDEGTPAYMAFAIVHCTAGDVLIGAAALLLALIVGLERDLARWHWVRLAVLTVFAGVGYTAFSEWLNTAVVLGWAYSERMPTLQIAGIEIGLSPLAQWVLLPPLALYLAATARVWRPGGRALRARSGYPGLGKGGEC